MNDALIVRTEMDVMTLGDVLVKSRFFSDSTQAAQAVVKVLAGHELGFGPIASMTGINIIKGRVTLSANLLAAAIKRSGKYSYTIKRLDDTGCELVFTENGAVIGETSFTKADADRAKLSGENWTKYPRNMMFARAISNGAKFFCPDIFGGPVYTPDELGAAIDGETGEVIDGALIDAPRPAINTGNLPPHVVDEPTPAPSELDAFFGPRHASDEPPADEHDPERETPPAAQNDPFGTPQRKQYHMSIDNMLKQGVFTQEDFCGAFHLEKFDDHVVLEQARAHGAANIGQALTWIRKTLKAYKDAAK